MPDKTKKKPVLLIPVRADVGDFATAEKMLPAVLQSASRGAAGASDPFLANVVVEESYPLAAIGRGETPGTRSIEDGHKLLALEAADGTTIFIRADRLQEELTRLYPEAVKDGQIDLSRFRDREGASRGLGDWIWQKVTTLRLDKDDIIDAAQEEALRLAKDWLGDKVQDAAELGASWIGTKALMWAIEKQLAGEPGLYHWRGGELTASDRCPTDADPRLAAAKDKPMLLFIHGTASHTLGGFKDLREAGATADWKPVEEIFGDRVFGFEHRTFSESPIDNTLQLARNLPAKAKLFVVTHSRGGLVGDLLCMGDLPDDLIAAYRRGPPQKSEEVPEETAWQRLVREKVVADEQAKLRELRALLNTKNFQIQRYLRVACPAGGTTLLSDNLDLFLSGLLSLTGKLVGAVAGPAGSAVYSAFKRIVLEIAQKRVQPEYVPGIEAMLPDAPMGMLLARTPRRQGVEMAVIAGDIEGGHILKRLGVMFTDWMFFDQQNNDLVVDTDSMYMGLAGRDGTRYLYDRSESANHFNYFENRGTRGGVRDWLSRRSVTEAGDFKLLEPGHEPTATQFQEKERQRSAARGEVKADTRPVVILLPGILGSHLELRDADKKPGEGDRVWFDPKDLTLGGFRRIHIDAHDVHEEGLFEMFYGSLADHLEASHTVIRFPYDWRKPIQDTAERLADIVREARRKHPNQPLRLLAHSMGGLVVRAMIAQHEDVWKDVVARPGSRFVMLGVPNHGSHAMVATLLGKADSVRKLARLDLRQPMQDLLDILAGFPGAVQLLPRPGFKVFKDSTGAPQDSYLNAKVWEDFRKTNKDRWFGDGRCGAPSSEAFKHAIDLWSVLSEHAIPSPDRVACVFGKADNTPCGIKVEDGRLKLIGTPEGDGSVSWEAGRLKDLPDERCWFMPVDHAALTDSEEHFPAIVELLNTGKTTLLGHLPASRGEAATRSYDAGPVPYPSEEELVRSLLGGKPKRRKARIARQRLSVGVVAMDLRNAQYPVMCGHYLGDPIAGAEWHIDQHLVDGALTQRERLGVYADEIGTSAVVLKARGEEEIKRGTGKGAVVVGLGKYGELSVGDVAETVRAGTLRLLLHAMDRGYGVEKPAPGAPAPEITLGSLLIGHNSTAHIRVEDSVSAIVRGVCEANRQFEEAMGARLQVGSLKFLELYLDTAVSAARAVCELTKRMDRDLRRLEVRIDANDQLRLGDGVRHRLAVSGGFGYWPRLMVTDADRQEENCPPECFRVRRVSPIPEEILREIREEERARIQAQFDAARGATESSAVTGSNPPPQKPQPSRPLLAERLRYVFLSERARAEAVVQQRQPGLIEAMIRQAIHRDSYDADLAHALFELMVPLDFKSAARETEQLTLLVDPYTANLPWEMLQTDDQPMVLKTAMVRQLVSPRFRTVVRSAPQKTACIIVDPSTEGYVEEFGKRGDNPLPRLQGAVEEGNAVRSLLSAQKYKVEFVPSESCHTDIIARLFKRPYRILMIAAHGVFQATARDGGTRSGVVLSDGVMLTAAEIGQLEVVPDLVFLNCCHLGQVSTAPPVNRLAYSISRELIEMGVRCVVAAGWAVNDQAACTFARTFFEEFVEKGRPFGPSVHEARKTTFDQHPAYNTWGAYQAYGDPGFVLEPGRDKSTFERQSPVAPEELIDDLDRQRITVTHDKDRKIDKTRLEVEALLRAAPREWADLPEVQAELGALYAEFGQEGFELARTAYLRALSEEDKAGRVPVKAIEQLANLEARIGEEKGCEEAREAKAASKTAAARKAQNTEETETITETTDAMASEKKQGGAKLIECAIERLKSLIAVTSDGTPQDDGAAITGTAHRANMERWSLLGSAWKRLAAVRAEDELESWDRVKEPLEASLQAYRQAEGNASAPGFNPYPVLNRLQLDALLSDLGDKARDEAVALAQRCKEQARQRFSESYDFFDAVMPAAAELAIAMVRRELPGATDALVRAYESAMAEVPRTARKFDSVVKQIRLLAKFYRLRGGKQDSESAAALQDVACRLDPNTASESGQAPALTPAAPSKDVTHEATRDESPRHNGGSGSDTKAQAPGKSGKLKTRSGPKRSARKP